MKIEVSILLGFNCNFRCSHCINDSKPGYKEYDLKRSESDEIIEQIIRNKNVTKVSFTGGEPLLFINEIKYLVESLRKKDSARVINFSITTNGSLISKNENALKAIGIDDVLISYDLPHSSFFETKDFENALIDAKKVFKKVEVATTYEKSPLGSLVSDLAIKHNVQVWFNRTIQGGRFNNRNVSIKDEYKTICCPNLESIENNRLKITYIPNLGFTFCCGPLLFDNLDDADTITFETIESLLASNAYLIQQKLSESKILCDSIIDCENCTKVVKDKLFKKTQKYLLNTNPWENTITTDSISLAEVGEIEKYFRLRRLGMSTESSFSGDITDVLKSENNQFVSEIKSELKLDEIEKISNFVINNFYKIFKEEYTEEDIETFRKQQPVFFSLPFRTITHMINGEISALLLVAQIDNHPFYKKSIWHIGYWGISQSIKDRNSRKKIKSDWQKLLKELSSTYQVGVIIDQFNMPSWKMAESFGMKFHNFRLDPRGAR